MTRATNGERERESRLDREARGWRRSGGRRDRPERSGAEWAAGSGAADSEPGQPRAGTGFPGKDSGGTNQSDSTKRGLRSTCRRAPEEEPRPLRSANHGAPARPEREALWDGGKRELGGLPGNGGERRGARASPGWAAGPRLFSALLPFRLRAQPF